MPRGRDDESFGDGWFEPDDGRRDAMSETVELAGGARTSEARPPRGPARSLLLLVAGAAVLGAVSFVAVSAVRGDGEGSPAASPARQTAPASPTEPAAAQTATAASAPATTAAVPVADALVPVRPGAEGEDVRALQEALDAAGFSAGEADGVYGAATVAAVATFQRSAGLAEDGIAGAETIAALTAAISSG